jgi:D-citramalate synthase
MDTTLWWWTNLRSLFSAVEKLTIAQLLLEELNVDRIEIASARKRRRISRSKRDNALWAPKDTKPHRSFNLVDGGLYRMDEKAGLKFKIYWQKDQWII